MGLRVLGTNVIVLNSMKAISDLLEKRGHIYSHRPSLVVACELMGLNKVRTLCFYETTGTLITPQSMSLMPYNAEWRASRKVSLVALSPTV